MDGAVPLLAIDGRAVTWEEFGRLLTSFEGWQFKLDITSQVTNDSSPARFPSLPPRTSETHFSVLHSEVYQLSRRSASRIRIHHETVPVTAASKTASSVLEMSVTKA